MPGPSEKARRKELLRTLREENRRAVRDDLPAAPAVLKALFSYIDARLSENDCDDTLRYAREFIAKEGLDEDLVVNWLEVNGGYCDCEAINNAEQVIEDAVPGYRDL